MASVTLFTLGLAFLPLSYCSSAEAGIVHYPVRAAQRRSGAISSSPVFNAEWLYEVEISLGTPPQKTYVLLDTGSSELWVNADCSTVPDQFGLQTLCETNSDYKVADSTSVNGPEGRSDTAYGDKITGPTSVSFEYYEDTVSIGDLKITGQKFGVATGSKGIPAGILGVAPELYQGFAVNESYPLVLDSLAAQKQIQTRAYSIGVGHSDTEQGSLIFGGYDRGLFTGPLATLPIVPSTENVTRLTAHFTSIGLTHSTTAASTPYTVGSDTNVMFDSGTTFINLNKELAEQIYADLNAKLDSGLGYYLVDCATRDMEGGLVIGFGDVSILISFNDLIFTAGGLCAVGVQGSDEGLQQILGVPFFRASYTIFDWDNEKIYVAQSANCTSSIVAISAGENAIAATTGLCGSNMTTTSSPTSTPSSIGVPSRGFKLPGMTYTLGLSLVLSTGVIFAF